MNIDRERVKNRSTDAVFERGVNYRDEERIQQPDRFGKFAMATINGSKLYDVTVELDGRGIDARCICLYDGGGGCKHAVVVPLDIAASPPQGESEHVRAVIGDVLVGDPRGLARDAPTEHPELCGWFLAYFDGDHRSVKEYREEVAQLFK